MKFQDQLADDLLLAELGGRIASLRLEKNLTQSTLAQQAGVGLRTLQRLEGGAVASQLSVLVRVLRVLGLIERLDLLIPITPPSPMAELKLAGKKRQRATHHVSSPKPSGPWKWGEQA